MKTIKNLLPHAQIVLAGMLLALAVIDRFNSAMAFIDNDITKALLTILCVLSITNACILIGMQRTGKNRIVEQTVRRG